jgi:hypothetical protein
MALAFWTGFDPEYYGIYRSASLHQPSIPIHVSINGAIYPLRAASLNNVLENHNPKFNWLINGNFQLQHKPTGVEQYFNTSN